MNTNWVFVVIIAGFIAMLSLFALMVHRENEMKINTHFKVECLKVGGSVVPIADTQNFSCIVGREKV